MGHLNVKCKLRLWEHVLLKKKPTTSFEKHKKLDSLSKSSLNSMRIKNDTCLCCNLSSWRNNFFNTGAVNLFRSERRIDWFRIIFTVKYFDRKWKYILLHFWCCRRWNTIRLNKKSIKNVNESLRHHYAYVLF